MGLVGLAVRKRHSDSCAAWACGHVGTWARGHVGTCLMDLMIVEGCCFSEVAGKFSS